MRRIVDQARQYSTKSRQENALEGTKSSRQSPCPWTTTNCLSTVQQSPRLLGQNKSIHCRVRSEATMHPAETPLGHPGIPSKFTQNSVSVQCTDDPRHRLHRNISMSRHLSVFACHSGHHMILFTLKVPTAERPTADEANLDTTLMQTSISCGNRRSVLDAARSRPIPARKNRTSARQGKIHHAAWLESEIARASVNYSKYKNKTLVDHERQHPFVFTRGSRARRRSFWPCG